ncbi:hypothetical protein [Streptomyces sp. B3I8]|uniref:hypothetical protein n=1 Tax=Streptomyces sp. B3I8 TaxID=3042303 RepID=UPI00277F99F6|nr:hypothetical protein [Streptomyces sp. B3I8]MDQ0784621.1 hypothetical protein [Streptomyces sp. B3I8]
MDDRRRRIDGAVTTVGELAAAEPLLDIPVRPFPAELEVERCRGGVGRCPPRPRSTWHVVRKLGGTARRWRFDRMATVCSPSSGQVTAAFATRGSRWRSMSVPSRLAPASRVSG